MSELIKLPERKYKRKKILAVVDLYKSVSDSSIGQGCLMDISFGGAAIESNVVFQKRQHVIMNIPLSSRDRYSIGGEILRVQEMPLKTFRYGIRFERMSLRERFELLRITPLLLKNKFTKPAD